MHYRQLQVGDTVPLDPSRKMQDGERLIRPDGQPDPHWYALLTPPQKERAARQYLRTHGMHSFFPSEERCSVVRGKKRCREAPIVPGYVYVRFTRDPQWDVIRARPFFSGVVALGIVPYRIPRAIVRRLQGLTVEAEQLAQAREATREAVRRALAPSQGDRAALTGGPLAGFLVDVTAIKGRMANILLPGGVKGQADLSMLRKEGVDLTTIPGYLPE